MNCPDCQAELAERKVAGVAIDECSGCAGVWFDHNELEQYRSKIVDRGRPAGTRFVAGKSVKNSRCPRCRVLTLRPGRAGQIPLLHCRNCRGMFMTRTVLTRLGRPDKTAAASTFALTDYVDASDAVEIAIEIICELITW